MFTNIYRLCFLVLLLLSGVPSIGQLTNRIKTIIELEDTVVRYMCKKDTSGKILFWKEDQGIVLMMGASYFDLQGRRVKSLSGHSNVGFTVWEYVFDAVGNEIEVYGYKEISVSVKDINPFKYISRYNSETDLENDSNILQMISNNKKYLIFRRQYDSRNNLIKDILFEENGDTANVTTNEYDYNNNVIHFTYKGDIGKWDYYYTYDTNGNQLSSKRVTSAGDTTEVHLYKYDSLNNEIEDKYLYQGELEYIETRLYEQTRCVKELFYDKTNRLISEESFEYDKYGNVAKKISINHEENVKRVSVWKYEYY